MSNSNVVRTAVAGLLQTIKNLELDLEIIPNSTLNQKLDIFKDVAPASTDRPATKYVGIGNGGHGFVIGSNNKVKYKSKQHTVRHTALYNQLPFVLRLVSNDLTAVERLRYRLRRLETYNGQTYAAYYLRVLDYSNTKPKMELRHVEDGVTTSSDYVPTLEDLNPVAPTLTADSAVTTTGDYIASTAKVVFSMSQDEVQEFVNAVKIIEGGDGYAIISEMCTVSGIDKSLNGDFNGVSQAYTDVINAQITSHISTAFVMEYMTDGISLTLDIGNVEPLLTTTAS